MDDVSILNIDGGGFATGAGQSPLAPYPGGIAPSAFNLLCHNVQLTGCTVSACGMHGTIIGDHTRIDNCNFLNSSRQALYVSGYYAGSLPMQALYQARDIQITNSKFLGNCLQGFWSGTTGIFLMLVDGGLINNCEISGTLGSIDGLGIDFEGGIRNVTVSNCNIHDCNGAALLCLGNGAASPLNGDIGNSFIGNTFTNNALMSPATVAAIYRQQDAAANTDNQIWNSNTITVATGATNLFASGPALTLNNTLRANFVSNGLNVVTNPSGGIPASF